LEALPGVAVLATPLIGDSLFDPRMANLARSAPTYVVSIACQMALAGVCFAAACRKFQRSDAVALGPDLGLLLLAIFSAISLLGIVYWEEFRPGILQHVNASPAVRFIGAVISVMLLSLLPLAGTARLREDFLRRHAIHDPSVGSRPAHPLVVAVFAAFIITLLAWLAGAPRGHAAGKIMLTAGTLLAFTIGVTYTFQLGYRLQMRGVFLQVLWIGGICLLPLLADGVVSSMAEYPSDSLGIISSFSPIGILVLIWQDTAVNFIPGLIGQ
jgi:hypothetical protein